MARSFIPLFKRVLKFGMASGIATGIDILLFHFLLAPIMEAFYADLISSSVGMLINFFLQKNYVFKLKRSVVVAFLLSITTSVAVMLLGSFTIKYLDTIAWFSAHLIVAKILVIGMKFGMNFFLKQWVFEKRFVPVEEDEKGEDHN